MEDLRSLNTIVKKVESTDKKALFTCYVDSSFEGFKGHFSDMPVVPGVVQVHWAVEAARIVTGDSNFMPEEITLLKFVNLLTPDTSFTIDIELIKDKWRFKIFNSEQDFASGRILPRSGDVLHD